MVKVSGLRDIILTALCREKIAAFLKDVFVETLVGDAISSYEGICICFRAEKYASATKIPTTDSPNNLFNIVSSVFFMT